MKCVMRVRDAPDGRQTLVVCMSITPTTAFSLEDGDGIATLGCTSVESKLSTEDEKSSRIRLRAKRELFSLTTVDILGRSVSVYPMV